MNTEKKNRIGTWLLVHDHWGFWKVYPLTAVRNWQKSLKPYVLYNNNKKKKKRNLFFFLLFLLTQTLPPTHSNLLTVLVKIAKGSELCLSPLYLDSSLIMLSSCELFKCHRVSEYLIKIVIKVLAIMDHQCNYLLLKNIKIKPSIL